jgi:hypothetical protein
VTWFWVTPTQGYSIGLLCGIIFLPAILYVLVTAEFHLWLSMTLSLICRFQADETQEVHRLDPSSDGWDLDLGRLRIVDPELL